MHVMRRCLGPSPAVYSFSQCAEQNLITGLSQLTLRLCDEKERTKGIEKCLVRSFRASTPAKIVDSSQTSDRSPAGALQTARQVATTQSPQNDALQISRSDAQSAEEDRGTSDQDKGDDSDFLISYQATHASDRPQQLVKQLDINKLDFWRNVFYLRENDTDMAGGIWRSFQQMLQSKRVYLLSKPEAGALRVDVVAAAASSPERTMCFMQAMKDLMEEHHVEWPGLYFDLMSRLLEQQDLDLATRVHFLLYRIMPPAKDAFGILLSNFATDASPEVQDTLKQLYMLARDRNVYDHLIPSLFTAGQSVAARNWRRKLVASGDFPSKQLKSSRSFLFFLSLYFPAIKLAEEELEVIHEFLHPRQRERSLKGTEISGDDSRPGLALQHIFLSDANIARLFASSWTSVEFAINILGGSGVKEVGPLALQSLGLREVEAAEIRNRLAQMRELEIQVADNVYSNMIVTFAQNGDQRNLNTILHCDVHPDEFRKPWVRGMLRGSAKKRSDGAMLELLETVDDTLGRSEHSKRLGPSFENKHDERSSADTKRASQCLDSKGLYTGTRCTNRLLKESFAGLEIHADSAPSLIARQRQEQIANQAITTVRRLANDEITIPLGYWKLLLYHLGRFDRLLELEQLCLEIVELYLPKHRGITEVHRRDAPRVHRQRPAHDNGTAWRSGMSRKSRLDGPYTRTLSIQGVLSHQKEPVYIPADLTFGHHQHPMYKLFERKLQRAIIRWGFLYGMRKPPTPPLRGRQSATLDSFDVAWGVRLLALLRDKGVLVDQMSLKSSLFGQIAGLQSHWKQRHRSRDSNETSLALVKGLVDEAWGSEILPPLSKLQEEVNREAVKLDTRYSKMHEEKSRLWRNVSRRDDESLDSTTSEKVSRRWSGIPRRDDASLDSKTNEVRSRRGKDALVRDDDALSATIESKIQSKRRTG